MSSQPEEAASLDQSPLNLALRRRCRAEGSRKASVSPFSAGGGQCLWVGRMEAGLKTKDMMISLYFRCFGDGLK